MSKTITVNHAGEQYRFTLAKDASSCWDCQFYREKKCGTAAPAGSLAYEAHVAAVASTGEGCVSGRFAYKVFPTEDPKVREVLEAYKQLDPEYPEFKRLNSENKMKLDTATRDIIRQLKPGTPVMSKSGEYIGHVVRYSCSERPFSEWKSEGRWTYQIEVHWMDDAITTVALTDVEIL